MAELVYPATVGPSLKPSVWKGLGASEVTDAALKGRHMAPQEHRMACDLICRDPVL